MTRPDPTRYRTTNWKSYRALVRHWFEPNGEGGPEAARFLADLVGQGHDVACAEGRWQWPTAGVQRCGCPVLFDGEGSVRAAASTNDRDGGKPTAAVAGVFDHWALSAQIDGRTDDAAALRETSASLSRSLQEIGTSRDDVGELMDAVKDAQGNTVFGPVTDERLALDRARAEEWIEEAQIPASELGLARRLVDDLDRSTPGLKAWLVNPGGFVALSL